MTLAVVFHDASPSESAMAVGSTFAERGVVVATAVGVAEREDGVFVGVAVRSGILVGVAEPDGGTVGVGVLEAVSSNLSVRKGVSVGIGAERVLVGVGVRVRVAGGDGDSDGAWAADAMADGVPPASGRRQTPPSIMDAYRY